MDRRLFLKQISALGLSMLFKSCAGSLPLSQQDFPSIDKGPSFTGFATSLYSEYSYEPEIEGIIPKDLIGTLYRIGPGLFDRGNMRKRALLDGDGMIQSFSFQNGRVKYQSRYVRTNKFSIEESKGRFIYPTISTQAPGGWLKNIFAVNDIKSQAGVTVIKRHNKLYAFDEYGSPYALNPENLETIGPHKLGRPPDKSFFSAHWKIDGKTGDWMHFGFEYGPSPKIHFTVFDKDNKLYSYRSVPLPRFVYVHDHFVSENYQILNLQPLYISIAGVLLGFRSMSDSLKWRPDKGSLILLIPRDTSRDIIYIEADPVFSWHTINAYEIGNEIMADFIGYSCPDHFAGKNNVISNIMQGKEGIYRYPGQICRFKINILEKKADLEILRKGNYEWPFINMKHRCCPYRIFYAVSPRRGEFFWSKICRIDILKGNELSFSFPLKVYCSEPVFVPKRNTQYKALDKSEPGYLLTQGYDGEKKKSFLAVFDAEELNRGPLAIIWLKHHVPFSFHGWWA